MPRRKYEFLGVERVSVTQDRLDRVFDTVMTTAGLNVSMEEWRPGFWGPWISWRWPFVPALGP